VGPCTKSKHIASQEPLIRKAILATRRSGKRSPRRMPSRTRPLPRRLASLATRISHCSRRTWPIGSPKARFIRKLRHEKVPWLSWMGASMSPARRKRKMKRLVPSLRVARIPRRRRGPSLRNLRRSFQVLLWLRTRARPWSSWLRTFLRSA
jgi:hypothetical protein